MTFKFAMGNFHMGDALPYDIRVIKKARPRPSVLDTIFSEEASDDLSTGLLDEKPDILREVLFDVEDEEPLLECQRDTLSGPHCPSIFYLLRLFTGLLLTTFQVPLMLSVNAVSSKTESLVLDH